MAERTLAERQAMVGVVHPVSANNTTKDSDWVDMSKYDRVIFYIDVGVTDCLVDAQLRSATTAAGANAAFISGKSITQYSATDDNKVKRIEISAAELTALTLNPGFVSVRVTISNATAALVSVLAIAEMARYEPATSIATLAQTIQ